MAKLTFFEKIEEMTVCPNLFFPNRGCLEKAMDKLNQLIHSGNILGMITLDWDLLFCNCIWRK